MKWPTKQLKILTEAFREVCESFGGVELINETYQKTPASYVWFQLYRIASYDLQFSDSHPAYSETVQDGETFPARVRRCKHNPEFVLYPPGCHDSHLKTALKHIARELGLRVE